MIWRKNVEEVQVLVGVSHESFDALFIDQIAFIANSTDQNDVFVTDATSDHQVLTIMDDCWKVENVDHRFGVSDGQRQHVGAFCLREGVVFVRIWTENDVNFIGKFAGLLDKVNVAKRNRVKTSGDNSDFHICIICFTNRPNLPNMRIRTCFYGGNMGFNTTVLVLNDALGCIAEDAEFGKKIADAVSALNGNTLGGINIASGSLQCRNRD